MNVEGILEKMIGPNFSVERILGSPTGWVVDVRYRDPSYTSDGSPNLTSLESEVETRLYKVSGTSHDQEG